VLPFADTPSFSEPTQMIGSQVARLELVLAHDVELRGFEGFPVERHVHLEDLRRIQQTFGVLVQAEDRGAAVGRPVRAHAFEDAHAVVQRMGQDVDRGVAPVDQLAVHPDLAVAVGH